MTGKVCWLVGYFSEKLHHSMTELYYPVYENWCFANFPPEYEKKCPIQPLSECPHFDCLHPSILMGGNSSSGISLDLHGSGEIIEINKI